MNSFKENSNIDENGEELNIARLSQTLLREKLPIFLITSLSSFITFIYLINVKPIWIGSFNIVISTRQNENPLTGKIGGALGTTLKIKGIDDNSTTQRLILKSPFVLNPVFEFVKSYYSSKGINTNDFSFRDWASGNLKIDFQEGSKVLDVKYKNTDKDLILEVLERISSRYQDYSKKQIKEDLVKTITYLTEQNDLMIKKSLESKKLFNKFSIENGLGNIDGFVGLSNNSSNRENLNLANLNLENPNQDNSSNFGRNVQKNINISNAGQRFQNQFFLLEQYETNYIELASKLKPNSKTLKELENKIENLRESLKRPNEILVEYNSLYNQALRDENLLNSIQTSLMIKNLELIETPEPWDLISDPTINKVAVFPKKKLGLISATFLSFVITSCIALAKNKFIGRFYYRDELFGEIELNYLESLLYDNYTLNYMILDKIISKRTIKEKRIGYVYIKNKVDTEILDPTSKIEIVSIKDHERINQFEKLFLIIQKGECKKRDIDLINKYIKLHKEKFEGWFFVE